MLWCLDSLFYNVNIEFHADIKSVFCNKFKKGPCMTLAWDKPTRLRLFLTLKNPTIASDKFIYGLSTPEILLRNFIPLRMLDFEFQNFIETNVDTCNMQIQSNSGMKVLLVLGFKFFPYTCIHKFLFSVLKSNKKKTLYLRVSKMFSKIRFSIQWTRL